MAAKMAAGANRNITWVKGGGSVMKQSYLMVTARLPRRAFYLNTVSVGAMEQSLSGSSGKIHLILLCDALTRASLNNSQ